MAFERSFILARLESSAAVVASLKDQAAAVERLCSTVAACVRGGGRVYTCGNGGSAAQAMHLAEELIGRYKTDRPALPGLCLNADPAALTCIANDYGFERVFSRQVEALARKGDALVVFSTSGESANVVRALGAARARGAATIGLLGKGGGACRPLCDAAVVVESRETELIQEAHLVVLHLILEAVEASAANNPAR